MTKATKATKKRRAMGKALEEVLLELVEGLGMTDLAIEDAAGLSGGFLSRAKRGEKRDPRSSPSWARVRAFLVTKLGPEKVDEALDRVTSPRKRAATAPPAPSPGAPPTALPSTDGTAVPPDEEIARRIGAVRTQKERLEVEQLLASAIVRGDVDPRRGELALDALKEMGKALEAELEERGRAQLAALEVLDTEELEWLAAKRAALTPAPSTPGSAVRKEAS